MGVAEGTRPGRTIKIDHGKHLGDEPKTGHNRWHPEIEPILEVGEGEEVALETRDAADGYLGPGTTVADLAKFPAGAVHPLTGPVLVKGARDGGSFRSAPGRRRR